MNPQELFCPNSDCPAKGQTGQGNIIGHGAKKPRFKCKVCGKTFSPTTGTAFSRLRHEAQLFTQVVTLLAWGCPLQAIVRAFGPDERTVQDGPGRAARQSQAVHEHLVTGAELAGEVQADELRIKGRGVIWWLAGALPVPPRLWLGGEVSARRDKHLIRAALAWGKRAVTANSLILLVTDGLSSYPSQARVVFWSAVAGVGRGRRRLVVWGTLWVGQVVKQYEKRRVVGVARRIKQGTVALVDKVRHKGGECLGVLNTAYSSRWNGTLRQRLNSVVRRGRNAVATSGRLREGLWLVGTVYNFCTGAREPAFEWN